MTALRPWAGWIGAVVGWTLSDQVGSDLAQIDCTRADPLTMLLIGIAGVAIALFGVALAWSERPFTSTPPPESSGVRQFIAGTGILAAGIFLLAILFQTVASFIIPQCHA